MNNSSCIGLFDSGVGGLTIAAEVHQLLPQETLYYVADNARAPYGSRKPEEVLQFSVEICDFLISEGAQLIVVACNTATGIAIDHLRAHFPSTLFVGIEPAVKPAAEQTKNGRVGVMATELTLASNRFARLIREYGSSTLFYSDPCKGLVPLIEAGNFSDSRLTQVLEDILAPMVAEEIDTLVLGCTHYPLVAPIIRTIVGDQVNIINPAPATAKQVVRLLTAQRTEDNPEGMDSPKGVHRFYATDKSLPLERVLGNLGWANRLVVPHFALNPKKEPAA